MDFNSVEIEIISKTFSELLNVFLKESVKKISTYTKILKERVKISSGAAFEQYLKTCFDKCSKIKNVLYDVHPVYIYTFYVHLDLINSDHKIVSGSDITNILSESRSLIITGTAGCGKSTLMKHFFINAALNTKYIPLFLELKEFNDLKITKDTIFVDLLYSILYENNLKLEKANFIQLVEKGYFIFFMDGFDEVNPGIENKIAREILKFRTQYNNIIIVTSRPSHHFISWQGFDEYSISSLTKEKCLKLLNKIDYQSDIKSRFIEEVDGHLYDKFASFLSNPLLTIIMLMTYNNNASIPEKLYLFFSQAYETIYNKHDATKQGFKRRLHSGLSLDDFEKVFSYFSFMSYVRDEYEFDESNILYRIDRIKNVIELNFDTRLYFEDLVESLCLLIKDGIKYTYTHRTFQEYFATRYLIKQSESVKADLYRMLGQRIFRDIICDLLLEIDEYAFWREYLIVKLEIYKKKLFFKDSISVLDRVATDYLKSFLKNIKIGRRNSTKISLNDTMLELILDFIVRRYRSKYGNIFKEVNKTDRTIRNTLLIKLKNGEKIKFNSGVKSLIIGDTEFPTEYLIKGLPELFANFLFATRVQKEIMEKIKLEAKLFKRPIY